MKKRNKALLIGGIGLCVLAAALLIGEVVVRSRAEEMIKKEFGRLTHGKYAINTGHIEIDIFNRSITLSDIDIRPDTTSFHGEAAQPEDLPKHTVSFAAERIMIAGVSYGQVDGKINLGIRKLQISRPEVSIDDYDEGAYRPAGDTLYRIHPIQIEIDRIILSYREGEDIDRNDTLRNKISGFFLETDRFLINDGEEYGDRFLVGGDTRISIGNITHMPEDESTRMEIDSIHIDTRSKTFSAASFGIIPTYSKEEFGYKSWQHKDWTKFTTGRIAAAGVDYDLLMRHKTLSIDSVSVAGLFVASYKNRNIQREEWVKPMYYVFLQRLPLKVDIRKTAIGNSYGQYEELAPGADKAAIIRFDSLTAEITGLTNIVPAKELYTVIRASATMMESALMQVEFLMPVDSTNNRFETVVSVGRTEMRPFNETLMPLTGIQIESGVIDKLDFHIVASDTASDIDMTLLYNGLEIFFIKQKDGKTEERKVLSDIVNYIFMRRRHSSDPARSRVHASARRDPYRSPFNYIWRTAFAGIQKAAGLHTAAGVDGN